MKDDKSLMRILEQRPDHRTGLTFTDLFRPILLSSFLPGLPNVLYTLRPIQTNLELTDKVKQEFGDIDPKTLPTLLFSPEESYEPDAIRFIGKDRRVDPADRSLDRARGFLLKKEGFFMISVDNTDSNDPLKTSNEIAVYERPKKGKARAFSLFDSPYLRFQQDETKENKWKLFKSRFPDEKYTALSEFLFHSTGLDLFEMAQALTHIYADPRITDIKEKEYGNVEDYVRAKIGIEAEVLTTLIILAGANWRENWERMSEPPLLLPAGDVIVLPQLESSTTTNINDFSPVSFYGSNKTSLEPEKIQEQIIQGLRSVVPNASEIDAIAQEVMPRESKIRGLPRAKALEIGRIVMYQSIIAALGGDPANVLANAELAEMYGIRLEQVDRIIGLFPKNRRVDRYRAVQQRLIHIKEIKDTDQLSKRRPDLPSVDVVIKEMEDSGVLIPPKTLAGVYGCSVRAVEYRARKILSEDNYRLWNRESRQLNSIIKAQGPEYQGQVEEMLGIITQRLLDIREGREKWIGSIQELGRSCGFPPPIINVAFQRLSETEVALILANQADQRTHMASSPEAKKRHSLSMKKRKRNPKPQTAQQKEGRIAYILGGTSYDSPEEVSVGLLLQDFLGIQIGTQFNNYNQPFGKEYEFGQRKSVDFVIPDGKGGKIYLDFHAPYWEIKKYDLYNEAKRRFPQDMVARKAYLQEMSVVLMKEYQRERQEEIRLNEDNEFRLEVFSRPEEIYDFLVTIQDSLTNPLPDKEEFVSMFNKMVGYLKHKRRNVEKVRQFEVY